MRHYFRYKDGYVNIDSENIYITATGNWQEAFDVKELRSKKSLLKYRLSTWGIYLIIICISIYNQSYLMLIIITALLGVNNLFGKTNAYKIPLSKLLSVNKTNNTAILNFYNEIG